MRKKDETTKADTCLATAHPDEMVFVLLGRDPAAPFAIRSWAAERVRRGKNVGTDAQIVEALECARVMEEEGRKWADLSRPCDWCGERDCDCSQRISCPDAGSVGHLSCGWCETHGGPRFMCPAVLLGSCHVVK